MLWRRSPCLCAQSASGPCLCDCSHPVYFRSARWGVLLSDCYLLRAGDDFFSGGAASKGGSKAAGSRSAAAPAAAAADPVDYSKYGNAKSISSDAYFGVNSADEAAAQQELRKYTSASAISSADYFGEQAERGTTSSGGNAEELMSRLKLHVEQEMQSVASMASEASRKVGKLLANLNR
jgi:ADP-ribosylation factor GTPase-activating protein 2/3